MDDCNVGDYWAVYKDDAVPDGEEGTEESIICAFIHKLVEERAVAIGLDNRLWAHSENKAKLIDRALHDFGIDPKTWK